MMKDRKMDEIAEAEPLAPFRRWFREAAAAEPLAEAMTLATVTPEGRPSARLVLLKGFDPRGFVFYTNLESRKSLELHKNPRAALCFHWKSLRRQVRIEGLTEEIGEEEANAYFATRPRESQLSAWASEQSRPLESRSLLEERFAERARRFGGAPVERPNFWSGFRVVPERIEFWEERPSRLHERILFTRKSAGWQRQRLYP
jgi:pyridoxamine 5'-phosphate oxidase